MSTWRDLQRSADNLEMPDIGGISGDTVQIIIIVIIALWLFRKVKALFFLFMMLVGFYYILQIG